MARSYQFVNSNRSRVKRIIENTKNKDQIFKYIIIYAGGNSKRGREPSVLKTREKLKKDSARKEWEKLIAQSCERTE